MKKPKVQQRTERRISAALRLVLVAALLAAQLALVFLLTTVLLQRVALAQRVAVQGANVLLIQAQLFDHSVRILGLDLFQPRAAQLQGPGGLAPDAAVDK